MVDECAFRCADAIQLIPRHAEPFLDDRLFREGVRTRGLADHADYFAMNNALFPVGIALLGQHPLFAIGRKGVIGDEGPARLFEPDILNLEIAERGTIPAHDDDRKWHALAQMVEIFVCRPLLAYSVGKDWPAPRSGAMF